MRVQRPLSVLDFLDPASRRAAFTLDQAQEAWRSTATASSSAAPPGEQQRPAVAPHRRAGCRPPAVKWDPRIFGIGAQILKNLGVGRMKLLASPRKIPSMTGFGLEVTGYATSPPNWN